MEHKQRLVLLDGYSLAYRAFYALPAESFSTTTGQHTNAVYGFTSMLLNLLRDLDPTHVAVAFDAGKRTFRTEEYEEYKAGRKATPSEFKGQDALILEVLEALNIPVVSKVNFEADDVIATLTKMAATAGVETLISTGDRDAFQLVDATTTVLWPKKGVSDLAPMTPEAVEEKYGVSPAQYPDLAALVGESSDNLPGVPGVGPKTAAKWIQQYGSLTGILEHAEELPGKAGQSLRDHEEQVRRNRRLNTLVADLELPVQIDDLARREWDREAVHRVFDSLEFRALRERLLALPTSESDTGKTSERLEMVEDTLSGDTVRSWLEAHGSGRCAVAVEGSWGQGAGEVQRVAVAAPDGHVLVVTTSSDQEGREALREWLAGSTEKVLHDAKGPLHALRSAGMRVGAATFDTALAAYLLAPDSRSYDLVDLLLRHSAKELPEGDSLAGQAAAVRIVAEALEEKLEKEGATKLLEEVELPLLHALVEMEDLGVAVDDVQLEELEEQFAHRVTFAQEAAEAAVGHPVNLGSPKQLQVVLFEELGMPKTKKTKTGYTTDADSLVELAKKNDHPFLEHLLEHRDAIKMRQTVEGLRKSIRDGRIHTTYQQMAAATGRLSSTDPNLQNIPIRTTEGRRIRAAFVPGAGYDTLLTADYSQIELRIMAHLSEDVELIEAFRSGEDLHRYVGSRVFDVAPEDVDAEMRAKVKAMSYGLAYGLSAFGLSRQLSIPNHEAQRLMDGYFERFGGVREYLRGVVAEARERGYTETILGRRRHLPDLGSSNRQRREIAERMALNSPIQGSAADIIKLAMLNVTRRLQSEGLDSRLLLQIHDELLVEVAPGETGKVEEILVAEMGSAAELTVPLAVSVGRGSSWYDAGH